MLYKKRLHQSFYEYNNRLKNRPTRQKLTTFKTFLSLLPSAAAVCQPQYPGVRVKLRVKVRGLPGGGLLVQRLVLRLRILALRFLQLESWPRPGRA